MNDKLQSWKLESVACNSKIKLEEMDIPEYLTLEDLHHAVDIKDECISEPECYEGVVNDDAKRQSYTCSTCDKEFSQKKHLTVHVKIHRDEKPFSCIICDYKCVQSANLRRHLRSHTGEKPFECRICNKKYGQNKTLQQHLLTHTNKKVYKCNLCGYKCFQIESIKFHLKTHKHDDPQCSCEMCTYNKWCETKGLQKTNLSDPMEAHKSDDAIPKIDLNRNGNKEPFRKASLGLKLDTNDKKPFACHICDYKYSRKDLLTIHLTTHVDEKPFACVTCGYRYSRKEHLDVHSRTHAGKALYNCEICDFKFSQKQLLKVHSKIHNEKPFICEICGYSYWRKEHLTVHLRTH